MKIKKFEAYNNTSIRYTGSYNGEAFVHVFELVGQDGITWYQYKGGKAWNTKKAKEKMNVSFNGLKDYSYSRYAKGSDGFNDFFKEKEAAI